MLTHFNISIQGKRHLENNKPCQDYSDSRRLVLPDDSLIIIAAIADGVGSLDFSQLGSKIAVSTFLDFIENELKHSIKNEKNYLQLIKDGFEQSIFEIQKFAASEQLPFLEFDTTLTATIFDGSTLWFGHIGDDGIIVLYNDGSYEMITHRHKGFEVNSVVPLRVQPVWQFGKTEKEVVSYAMMTDGLLDYCVDYEVLNNRIFFPFIESALTYPMVNDDDAAWLRNDWHSYFLGEDIYNESFREFVDDDITLVSVQNPQKLASLPKISFDYEKWETDSKSYEKVLHNKTNDQRQDNPNRNPSEEANLAVNHVEFPECSCTTPSNNPCHNRIDLECFVYNLESYAINYLRTIHDISYSIGKTLTHLINKKTKKE